ncbi:GH116 family glycosyl hydrolase [Puia sp. P3]|uniref:GH116 family glycosyl hydrolase n=1 Tax=Puia sp. P3 TaxID=3423952 RepID=UPI003D66AD8D
MAQIDASHLVPADKGLDAAWQKSLYDTARRPFTGNDLSTIGMPCGGIAAGQLYVRGDGTLAGWWIANNAYNTGYGVKNLTKFPTALGPWKVCYQSYEPVSYIDQGFTIRVDGAPARPLDKTGFDAIVFTGEYPVATVQYKDKNHPLPVDVQLQVYSPFIPLDARESATPATVLQYTLVNSSAVARSVRLEGKLQNMVGLDLKGKIRGMSHNRVVKDTGLTAVYMDLQSDDIPATHPYNGNVCLSVLEKGDGTAASSGGAEASQPLGEPLVGAVGVTVRLAPHARRTVVFVLSWYFPNRPHYVDTGWNRPLSISGPVVGNNYANWFSGSLDVVRWMKGNLPRLKTETFAFHDAYYQSTIPYWLNRRLLMPLSTLATETCQWWATGKFWAWEGVGSCVGTCTHVWNYEQGMAHLFPELDRNIREQTDLSVSFQEDGSILARDGGYGVLIDGDAGTLLKAWREHLMSKDGLFLARNWPRLKRAMQYLIKVDGNADGLIETVQPNTYDIAFYGANTYVGGLYLGALRATERMARVMRDTVFADSCQLLAQRGSENTSRRLFNGEYFIQDVDLGAHPQYQYGHGCLADQVFGQTWADLTGLGDIYPADETLSALRSIWRYNWAPDVGVQNKLHPAERDYADPGEAGLFICTWPHSPHPGENGVRYRDEVWTGIEYQVATSMLYAGMTGEALSIVKAVDDRYQPNKHNPWNEVECGDHYARAMASWGVLLAIEGYSYNGPDSTLGFAPRLQPENFRGFFSAAEGWGTLGQRRSTGLQVNSIQVSHGRLPLRELDVELPAGLTSKSVAVSLGGQSVPYGMKKDGQRLMLYFRNLTVEAGRALDVKVTY